MATEIKRHDHSTIIVVIFVAGGLSNAKATPTTENS
jgi:hypothetical protein